MKRKAAVIGFVIFVLIDVVLFIALRNHVSREQVIDDDTTSTPSAPATPPATEGPTTTNGRTSLTLSDTGILAKVWRGRCVANGQPRIELSSDQGKTFDEIALPLLTKADATEPGQRAVTVRTILFVRVDSPEAISVIASDEACKARRFDTTDRGASWTESQAISAWYVDAAGTGVASPGGPSEPDCDIVALSPFSERNAKVACADGTILGTDDNGEEWLGLGALPGVTGMTFQGLRDGYAIASDDGCEARLSVTYDAGSRWDRAGCIAKVGDAKSLVGGAGNLLALVGDEVHRSTDAGQTWTVQSAQ